MNVTVIVLKESNYLHISRWWSLDHWELRIFLQWNLKLSISMLWKYKLHAQTIYQANKDLPPENLSPIIKCGKGWLNSYSWIILSYLRCLSLQTVDKVWDFETGRKLLYQNCYWNNELREIIWTHVQKHGSVSSDTEKLANATLFPSDFELAMSR